MVLWVNDIGPNTARYMTIYICSVRLESNIIMKRANGIRVNRFNDITNYAFLFAKSSIEYLLRVTIRLAYDGLINNNLFLTPTVKTVLLEYLQVPCNKYNIDSCSIDFKMYNFDMGIMATTKPHHQSIHFDLDYHYICKWISTSSLWIWNLNVKEKNKKHKIQ